MYSTVIERTEREDGVVISTIALNSMLWAWYGKYETAIATPEHKEWRIAEGYKTLKRAKDGHEKYKAMSIGELERLEYIG